MSEGPYIVRNVSTPSETKYSITGPTNVGYLSEHTDLLDDMAATLNAAHKAGVEEGRKQIIAAIQEAGLDDDARDSLLLSIAANTAADWLRSLK